MDCDEAIRLLKGGPDGIREWNQRREQDEEIPDLRGADLSGPTSAGPTSAGPTSAGPTSAGPSSRGRPQRGRPPRGRPQRGRPPRGRPPRGRPPRGRPPRGRPPRGRPPRGRPQRGRPQRGRPRWSNLQSTIFGDVDLSEVKGLESIKHEGPSTIGVDTLVRSRGKIPEAFLRGCGFTPWEALAAKFYSPELTPPGFAELQYQVFDAWTKGRSMINGCFVSYSRADAGFVDKLRDHLMSEGINVWLDRHDMVAGTIQDQVWRAIQIHHVAIIVLSKDSVESDWVENELDMARQKEKAEKRAVLCPICLDDAWKAKVAAKDTPGDPSRQLWRTLQQKLVVDFHGWETGAFEGAFQKLLRGLKTNYVPPAGGNDA